MFPVANWECAWGGASLYSVPAAMTQSELSHLFNVLMCIFELKKSSSSLYFVNVNYCKNTCI